MGVLAEGDLRGDGGGADGGEDCEDLGLGGHLDFCELMCRIRIIGKWKGKEKKRRKLGTEATKEGIGKYLRGS